MTRGRKIPCIGKALKTKDSSSIDTARLAADTEARGALRPLLSAVADCRQASIWFLRPAPLGSDPVRGSSRVGWASQGSWRPPQTWKILAVSSKQAGSPAGLDESSLIRHVQIASTPWITILKSALRREGRKHSTASCRGTSNPMP